MDNRFVRSFMLCEALHAYGPTLEELLVDSEFTEAKTFQEYLTCKRGWLELPRGRQRRRVCVQATRVKGPQDAGNEHVASSRLVEDVGQSVAC
jgi:hypothetical protein